MGRLNDVSDELWGVAREALLVSVEEAASEVRCDLHENDHHGTLILNTVVRRIREVYEASARTQDGAV